MAKSLSLTQSLALGSRSRDEAQPPRQRGEVQTIVARLLSDHRESYANHELAEAARWGLLGSLMV